MDGQKTIAHVSQVKNGERSSLPENRKFVAIKYLLYKKNQKP